MPLILLFLFSPGRPLSCHWYQVDDVIDSDMRNYIYEFNACAPAFGVPSACAQQGGAPAPAYQVFNDSTNRCVLLGSLAQSSWSLIGRQNLSMFCIQVCSFVLALILVIYCISL